MTEDSPRPADRTSPPKAARAATRKATPADKFPPPDLTLDQPKPAQVKPKPAKK